MRKFSWRDLIGEPQLCEGGRLASVVFCNPCECECPLFREALRRLGINKQHFLEVMDRFKVVVDGYNLALAPSPERPDERRDKSLLKLGWSLSKYLNYKFEILCHLIPKSRLQKAFNKGLLRQFALQMLDLNTKKIYRALAWANLDLHIALIIEILEKRPLEDESIEKLLSTTKSKYVGVRLPTSLLNAIDTVIEKGLADSRSEVIRKALLSYLSQLGTPSIE